MPGLVSWSVFTMWLGAERMEVCQSSVLEPGAPGSSIVEPGLKRLSFAYQSLQEIPYDVILKQRDTLEVLDLSYNLLDEYPLLRTSYHVCK